MNMSNTTPGIIDTTEYAKVTKSTSWQELVPFLRTGDIVTVHHTAGTTVDAVVKVHGGHGGHHTVQAGARYLRFADGALNSAVTDVVLQSASGRADDLEPLVASLRAGDVVRATFLVPQAFSVKSHAMTLVGTVEVYWDGDVLLAVENEDGGTPGLYDFTFNGRISWHIRALEVIAPDKGAEDAAPLTFAAYAARAAETAVYPGAGTFWGLQYVTAGLSSEAGEVIGKVSKMQRDGGYTPESSTFWGGDRDDLIAELGNVAWYRAMACLEADISPNEVLRRNLAKLADRAARDTIQGSGDNR